MDLSDLRHDYGEKHPEKLNWPSDPYQLFSTWLNEAVNFPITDANAMVLSTSTRYGKPSSRVVLLKKYEKGEGFIFFSDYESQKGKEIEINPQGALLFYWNVLEKQIRIEGRIKKLETEQSDIYFNSRPIESKLSTIVSRQSQPIKTLDILIKMKEELRNSKEELVRPDRWGGYILTPDKFEFWLGGPNRFNHRIEYSKDKNSNWKKQLLAP